MNIEKLFNELSNEDLLKVRKVLINPKYNEQLLVELDNLFLDYNGNKAVVDKEVSYLLKGFDINRLYLNKRSENACIYNGCRTIYDISMINDLSELKSMGISSINNIKVNMMFIEKYLFDLVERCEKGKTEFIKCDDFKEKYEIILRRRPIIFEYLERNGLEFVFANSDNASIRKAHKNLVRFKHDETKISDDEYRIINCLADYTFLEELEEIKKFTGRGYECFDKFITKKR